jgi:hypothetical protein
LQVVLESSSDQDHAVGNAECRSNDAPGKAVGSDSNVFVLNGSRASHGVAQVTIHLQIASKGTVVVDVYNANMVMNW